MSCNYQPNFQNVESLGQYLLYTQLEHNIKHFLDWGFLNIGGFVNINIVEKNTRRSILFKYNIIANLIWFSISYKNIL
jgi:hypothetical protein